MSVLQRWCALIIVAVALLARVWALDFKPAHFDEGVNGNFIDGMRTLGAYHYDPANYHGPLHFYVLFAGQQLFGRSLWVLRMPTVLAGTAAVALMLMFRRFLPFRAVALAATFAAISPALIFYSRYAIHETWLVTFALLAAYGGFGLATGERRNRDLWCTGMGLTGMVLTKETYLLHFIAALMALGAVWLFGRMLGYRRSLPMPRRRRPADLFTGRGEGAPEGPRELRNADVAAVWLVSIGLLVAFYSGFGFHWEGARGMLHTFTHMHAKGTHSEAGHNKEMFYWAKLLAYYEWPALAGLLAAPFLALPRSLLGGFVLVVTGVSMLCMDVISLSGISPGLRTPDYLQPNLGLSGLGSTGALAALIGFAFFTAVPTRNQRIQWLALYGMASFAAYSLIPYKTPWCSINFLWPFCFVTGYVLDRLCITGSRLMVALVTVMLCAGSVQDAHRLNFVNPVNDALPPTADTMPDGERYAYVQTTFDINKLLRPARTLVKQSASHRQMTGLVLGEPFPLVWELNDFPHVRFQDPAAQLPNYDADFLLIPDNRREDIEPQLVGIYFREPCLPRGGGEPSWLYLQAERFRPALAGERTPELKPRVPQFR